ncbi:cell division protein FtsX [Neisseria sp. HMSC31F04]|uniref:permease-like cell division protein FtsX n=1 Tax=Neisseria sp. HMSC31F04 TaxID=1581075 RepID=UPI0008A4EF36|nr:permease-like cell division protein FtsX [Neisseria sp. HMSC31F04]OFS99704.1 cell division protein FtsX [Neisseria sp. HMSC31F04]
MNYFTLHFEAAKNAVRQLFKQPLATLLILVMLAIAMSLPLALYLGVQSSQAVLGKLNESPQITLYMEQNADEADSAVVKELLAADKRIEKSEFIGKTQGLSELQTSMGEQDIVSMLDSNPLPDAFVVSPKPGGTPSEMQTLRQDLAKLPMVESAQLDTEWMQTLYQIDDFVQKVLAFLSVTLSVAFVLVAHNTIRLQILSRKEEIEITKLLGAPSSFIRRPFLYQAVWQSLLAAGLSLALCAWLIHATQPLVAQIFRPYGLNIEWRFFHTWEWLSVCGIVAALGIAGAWLATRQHLLSFKAKR